MPITMAQLVGPGLEALEIDLMNAMNRKARLYQRMGTLPPDLAEEARHFHEAQQNLIEVFRLRSVACEPTIVFFPPDDASPPGLLEAMEDYHDALCRVSLFSPALAVARDRYEQWRITKMARFVKQ